MYSILLALGDANFNSLRECLTSQRNQSHLSNYHLVGWSGSYPRISSVSVYQFVPPHDWSFSEKGIFFSPFCKIALRNLSSSRFSVRFSSFTPSKFENKIQSPESWILKITPLRPGSVRSCKVSPSARFLATATRSWHQWLRQHHKSPARLHRPQNRSGSGSGSPLCTHRQIYRNAASWSSIHQKASPVSGHM